MTKHSGVLPDSMIRSLVSSKCISGIEDRHIGPASVDLPLSDEMYRVAHVFLPRPGEKIRDILKFAGASRHNYGMPLERGAIYLAKIDANLCLPENIYGYCNPKSSTGRIDVHARVVADGVSRYDTLTPRGFSGELWVFVKPQLIPVLISPGEALSQARFFDSDTRLGYTELALAYREYGFLSTLESESIQWSDILIQDYDGSLILTLDLKSDPIGWECLGSNRVLDFSKRNHRKDDFFRPIQQRDLLDGALFLRKNSFLILSSAEAVRVPPAFACEMVAMDDRSGEFRSHYAGFIDPGWGCGNGGRSALGDPLTLEIRPFEDIVIRSRQPVAKIRYEKMIRDPDKHYAELIDRSNYLVQRGPKLSKHFT